MRKILRVWYVELAWRELRLYIRAGVCGVLHASFYCIATTVAGVLGGLSRRDCRHPHYRRRGYQGRERLRPMGTPQRSPRLTGAAGLRNRSNVREKPSPFHGRAAFEKRNEVADYDGAVNGPPH